MLIILTFNIQEFGYIIKIVWFWFCNALHLGPWYQIKFISKYFYSFCHILTFWMGKFLLLIYNLLFLPI